MRFGKHLSLSALALMLVIGGCQSSSSSVHMSKPRQAGSWHATQRTPTQTPASESRTAAPEAQAEAQPPRAAPAAAPAGMVRGTVAVPTGDRNTSGLLIEKEAPAEVNVNDRFDYTIRVLNLTDTALSDVRVVDYVPADYELIAAEPRAEVEDGSLSWELGRLGPRAEERITVSGRATQLGMLNSCATGSYALVGCVATNVTEPDLVITKRVTDRVLQCEAISYTLQVSNTGTGVARNVQVRDELPEGLTTADGQRRISRSVGDLKPGESRDVTLQLKAGRTGKLASTARATADGGLEATAEGQTTVVKPKLTLSKAGPETLFVGRDLTYTLEIANTGDGEAREASIVDNVPSGTQFVSASHGGRLQAGQVTWDLGTLQPGDERALTLTIRPTGVGRVRNAAAASAFCAEAVTDTADTNVQGIAAILLEVIDENDPVAVGSNEIYRIVVTNQGSAVDTNIAIRFEMTDAMQFVSASGPTRHAVQNRVLNFGPLASLAPGGEATWTVQVRAIQAGNQRIRTEMTSDQLGADPVIETEATRFYE